MDPFYNETVSYKTNSWAWVEIFKIDSTIWHLLDLVIEHDFYPFLK